WPDAAARRQSRDLPQRSGDDDAATDGRAAAETDGFDCVLPNVVYRAVSMRMCAAVVVEPTNSMPSVIRSDPRAIPRNPTSTERTSYLDVGFRPVGRIVIFSTPPFDWNAHTRI